MSLRVLALVLAIALGGLSACSSGPGAPSAAAGATSYTEFHDAFCAAFDEMCRAIGNPDTGSESALRTRLEQAFAAGDAATVDKVAAEITAA
ncbi:MAG TPA: hypothetical protein VK871_07355, partial [Candidatus Limnocylindrales bacterium]|nr:hypothetical protein [Candidatus Limnocylindrales bacterium]